MLECTHTHTGESVSDWERGRERDCKASCAVGSPAKWRAEPASWRQMIRWQMNWAQMASTSSLHSQYCFNSAYFRSAFFIYFFFFIYTYESLTATAVFQHDPPASHSVTSRLHWLPLIWACLAQSHPLHCLQRLINSVFQQKRLGEEEEKKNLQLSIVCWLSSLCSIPAG